MKFKFVEHLRKILKRNNVNKILNKIFKKSRLNKIFIESKFVEHLGLFLSKRERYCEVEP